MLRKIPALMIILFPYCFLYCTIDVFIDSNIEMISYIDSLQKAIYKSEPNSEIIKIFEKEYFDKKNELGFDEMSSPISFCLESSLLSSINFFKKDFSKALFYIENFKIQRIKDNFSGIDENYLVEFKYLSDAIKNSEELKSFNKNAIPEEKLIFINETLLHLYRIKLQLFHDNKDFYLNEIVKLNEFTSMYSLYLKVRLLINYGKYNEAIDYINQINKKAPNKRNLKGNPFLTLYKAEIYYRQKNYRYSIKLYEEFIILNDKIMREKARESFGFWFPKYCIALNYYKLGNTKLSEEAYMEARKSKKIEIQRFNPIQYVFYEFSKDQMETLYKLEKITSD